jgi:UDP-glucose 4-epimerase
LSWLVTGGAGYIGSHVARVLAARGYDVVVLDDLSSGHREFIAPEMTFVEASITDDAAVRAALRDHDVTGVVHLAGFKYAGVSVQRPLHTYWVNVEGTRILLDAMVEHEVNSLVFSSSCAVFGTPASGTVREDSPWNPESPYGETKLIAEWLIRDVAAVTPMRAVSLRYFNVVGSGWSDLYDTSPHNLFPLVASALEAGKTPFVNGADYPTPDGSCIRDYVHVLDLADAHVAAAEALVAGRPLQPAYNLGSGGGTSVLEIMAAFQKMTGIDFTPEIRQRRPGDPVRVVAEGDLAQQDIGWTMSHNVEEMVSSAWEAWRSRPSAPPLPAA